MIAWWLAMKDQIVRGTNNHQTFNRTNSLTHINEKKYHLVERIKFIWSKFTSLTDWLLMGKNMKFVLDLEKLQNLQTNFWNNSWMLLFTWLDDSKPTNIVAVVKFAEKPLSTIIWRYFIAFDGLLCFRDPWMTLLYVWSSGEQLFPSIFSNSSLASFISPSLQSPLIITLYVETLGCNPLVGRRSKSSLAVESVKLPIVPKV